METPKPLTSSTIWKKARLNCAGSITTSPKRNTKSWKPAYPRAWLIGWRWVSERVKILILKPSSLGDVVQALPVLRLIKRSLPQSEIFWWLDAGLAPLLEGDPDLTGIIPFQRERWRSPWRWPEAWRSLRAIRAQNF